MDVSVERRFTGAALANATCGVPMPIVYEIDFPRRRVSSTIEGVIRTADVAEFIDTLRREQALDFSVLADARGLAPPFVSPEDIWQIAAILSALKGEVTFGPRAIIVDSASPMPLARMFEILVSAFLPVKAFRDLAAAEAWLAESEIESPSAHRAAER